MTSSVIKCDPDSYSKASPGFWKKQLSELNEKHRQSMERLSARTKNKESIAHLQSLKQTELTPPNL